MVEINKKGRYLVLPQFDDSLSLQQREKMILPVGDRLRKELGVATTDHSVLGSDDPDDVPFFCDPPLDDDFHYNYAHSKCDF